MTSTSTRVGVAGFTLMIGIGLIACTAHMTANEGADWVAAGPPVDDQAASELLEHHRHHHGGVTQFVTMGLDTLGVEDSEVPNVERLQGELESCLAPASEIDQTLLSMLADGVAAGAIASAKVEATIARLEPAAEATQHCSTDALNRLHNVLTSPERMALVEKVEAHWEVWRQVNYDEEADRERGGRLADLEQDVLLTSEQVAQISAALPTAYGRRGTQFGRGVGEAQVQAFATQFPRDVFDARTLSVTPSAHFATHAARGMALFYETVTPLLSPGQRSRLSEHLREHSTRPPTVSAN